MKERAKYLDYSKGLVILLMLFAHTMSGNGSIRTYISSFHMQFFFIVSGILLARKYTSISAEDFCKHIKSRLIRMGVPYLLFSMLLTGFYNGLDLISGRKLHVVDYLKRIIFLQGLDSLWFLPVYFFSEAMMLCFLIRKQAARKAACGAAIIIVLILCLLTKRMPTSQPIRLLIKVLIGFVFVYYGYELEKRKVLSRIRGYAVVSMLILGAAASYFNGFAAVGSLELQNGILFFLSALFTSTAILTLFLIIERNKKQISILEFFGRNTIVVLCTNNLLIESIRLIDYKVTGDFLLNSGLIGSIIFTALLAILEVPIMLLSRGPLAIAFGKRRNNI